MENLDKKFRQDTLSSGDLSELRKRVNAGDGSELESIIHDTWMGEDIDTLGVSTPHMDEVKNRIDLVIGKNRSTQTLLIRVSQIAAAILLPVFIITSFYFYRENNQLASEEMVVSTEKGERASILLPDGTKVMLNSESTLSYNPKVYNRKERKVHFEGEGHFQVGKDKEHPFQIDATGLKVKVLGTTFNLNVRKHRETAELALEEGSVLFSSVLTNANVTLKPNQTAVLNQVTGKISVLAMEAKVASAWRRGELIFHNTALSDVVESIGNNFGIVVKVNDKDCLADLFTGTLDAVNLNEALKVIERSFHLKATISEDTISFGPN